MSDGKVLGALSFGTTSRAAFSADERGLIEAFAAQVSIALERARASAAVAESRDRLEAVLGSITDAYFAVDPEWRVLEVNQVAEQRVFGREAGAVVGTLLWSHLQGEADLEVHRQEYELARSSRRSVSYEAPFRAGDGAWFEHHVHPRGDRLEVYLRDVSQRKWAEVEQERLLDEVGRLARSLEDERDLLRTIMERTDTSLVYLDTGFTIVEANSAYVADSGHSREELIGADHFALFPDPENRAIFERVRDRGEGVSFAQKPFVFDDQPWRGTTYWDWTLTPVKDQEQRVRGLVLSLQNVTGAVRAALEREKLLSEIDVERRLMAAVFDKAPVGIVVLDGGTLAVKRANDVYRSFLDEDFHGRDLRGLRLDEFLPGAEESGLVEIFREVATTGEPWEAAEYEYSGFARGVTYWRWSLQALPRSAKGPPDLMLLVVETTHEVRARREVEELAAAAQHQADELDAVFASLSEGVLVYDPSGRVMRANPAAVELLGLDLALLGGGEAREGSLLRHPDGSPVEAARHPVARALAGRSVAGEELIVARPDRADVVVLVSVEPLIAKGAVLGAVAVLHDVTERKRDERQIVASLREKEVLLKEIHHRVKNNLQIVASLLNLQLASNPDPSLRVAVDEARLRVRALALVHEKLYGSKDLTSIDIRDYLHDLLTTLSQSLRQAASTVRIREEIAPATLSLDATTPLALIVNELVSNALKHGFPEGRGGEVVIGLRAVDESRFVLTVADDGVGLPEELDPRSTTSLGLQLVNLLVSQLGGTPDVDRERGARFTVTFSDPS